ACEERDTPQHGEGDPETEHAHTADLGQAGHHYATACRRGIAFAPAEQRMPLNRYMRPRGDAGSSGGRQRDPGEVAGEAIGHGPGGTCDRFALNTSAAEESPPTGRNPRCRNMPSSAAAMWARAR